MLNAHYNIINVVTFLPCLLIQIISILERFKETTTYHAWILTISHTHLHVYIGTYIYVYAHTNILPTYISINLHIYISIHLDVYFAFGCLPLKSRRLAYQHTHILTCDLKKVGLVTFWLINQLVNWLGDA